MQEHTSGDGLKPGDGGGITPRSGEFGQDEGNGNESSH